MVPTIVGVPVGVKPVVPHSISHIVDEPFSVQPKSTELAVILVAIKDVGARHVGASITKKSSTPKSLK